VTRKVIQVPMDEELLTRIDEMVGRVAESRAAFIREACQGRLEALKGGQLDRQYVEGYRRKPEEAVWAKATARLLSRVLPREKW
jgi:metal-responsive CopG/Arc/MetJ family transcriptional regulator